MIVWSIWSLLLLQNTENIIKKNILKAIKFFYNWAQCCGFWQMREIKSLSLQSLKSVQLDWWEESGKTCNLCVLRFLAIPFLNHGAV
jgi:hypothetical protein